MKDELRRIDDAGLRALMQDARAELERRAQERKKAALAEIGKLAAQAGIKVAVTGTRRKRGRPPGARPA